MTRRFSISLSLMLALLWCPPAAAKDTSVRVATARQLGAAAVDCGGELTTTGWEVRLCVTARFRDDSFNDPLYLGGMKLKAEASGAEVTLAERPALGSARWLVVIRYTERPSRPAVRLVLAGRAFTASLKGLPWSAAGGGHRADGFVDLAVARPTWAVLRSMRFLAVDRPGSSLLELVVENHSPRPFPVGYVSLHAGRDTMACANPSPQAPVQTVKVHWPAVTGRRRPGDPSGATTTLHGETVEVETKYQAETCSNNESFSMRIPVANVVAPGEVSRLLYRFDEEWGDIDADGTPKGLRDWDQVKIEVEADAFISPDELSLVTGRRGNR